MLLGDSSKDRYHKAAMAALMQLIQEKNTVTAAKSFTKPTFIYLSLRQTINSAKKTTIMHTIKTTVTAVEWSTGHQFGCHHHIKQANLPGIGKIQSDMLCIYAPSTTAGHSMTGYQVSNVLKAIN